MQHLGRLAFRTIVLVYAALLVVGAWPFRDAPIVGPPADWARWLLGTLSIRPGMEVFNAGEPAPVEWKLAAVCHRLAGVRADGGEEVLYAKTCPVDGTRLDVDYLETLLQRLSRASRERVLLERLPSGAPDHRTRDVQRFIALGDWACRRDDAFRSVRLVMQRRFQSYATGAHRASPVLACTWYCDEHPAPRPDCRRLPADDPSALVGAAP